MYRPRTQMTDLYFAPASERKGDGYAYRHFCSTVLSPVSVQEVHGLPLNYKTAVPIWGIAPGTAKQYKPNPGDFLLFYTGDGEYEYAAQVDQVAEDPSLAMDLWPDFREAGQEDTDTPGEPWSTILYLSTVWKVNIPGKAVQNWRRAQDNIIRNFNRYPQHRCDRLKRYFGSVQEFLFNWGKETVATSN